MSGFDDLVSDMEEEGKVKLNDSRPVNHIAFVMDHSGSMCDLAEQSRTNFNEQLEQIKKDSDEQSNYVTIIEFDSKVKEVCRGKDINAIEPLKTYWLGGMTALYDAIMYAVSCIENDMPKEGNHAALVTIITDGFENASVENKWDEGRLRIKERIERLQKTDNWTFVFMGANQDVLETAVDGLGVNRLNTISFDASNKGVRDSGATYKMSYENYSSSRLKGATNTTNFFNNDTKDDTVKTSATSESGGGTSERGTANDN